MEKKPHPDKKKTLLKGIGMNIIGYLLLALILLGIGVPANVITVLMIVLLGGLVILGYTFYYHK